MARNHALMQIHLIMLLWKHIIDLLQIYYINSFFRTFLVPALLFHCCVCFVLFCCVVPWITAKSVDYSKAFLTRYKSLLPVVCFLRQQETALLWQHAREGGAVGRRALCCHQHPLPERSSAQLRRHWGKSFLSKITSKTLNSDSFYCQMGLVFWCVYKMK